MKKSPVQHKSEVSTCPYGYLVFDYEIRELEGRILTLIESLGLKDTQEKATKDIARDIVYRLYRSTYITGEAAETAIEASRVSGSGMSNVPVMFDRRA